MANQNNLISNVFPHICLIYLNFIFINIIINENNCVSFPNRPTEYYDDDDHLMDGMYQDTVLNVILRIRLVML